MGLTAFNRARRAAVVAEKRAENPAEQPPAVGQKEPAPKPERKTKTKPE